jgi:hypothetical protein
MIRKVTAFVSRQQKRDYRPSAYAWNRLESVCEFRIAVRSQTGYMEFLYYHHYKLFTSTPLERQSSVIADKNEVKLKKKNE